MTLKNLGAAASGATDILDVQDAKTLLPWTSEVHCRESTARATGTMDAPLGTVAPYAMTLNEVDLRYSTGDATGSSSIYHIYKNGADFTTAVTIDRKSVV